MIRGIYTAATGMLAQQAVLDSLANNLANINTAGFKQDIPTFRALHEMELRRFAGGTPVGNLGTGVAFDGSAIDNSAGSLAATHNPLDLALVGDGFFTVQTPQGERYTRDGQLHVEAAGKGPGGKVQGFLVNVSGQKILGLKGPIQVSGTDPITVDADGKVWAGATGKAGGTIIDQLKLVTAPAGALKKEGGNLLSIQDAPRPAKPSVRSGFIEQANVNPISEMVRMITVQRAYDAAQRAVLAQDETLGKAVSEVGRV